MIRALACLLAVSFAPVAQAQSLGLPPGMAPCGDTHFDADRYRADLEALGWVLIPALNRAVQIERLVQSFAALSVEAGTAVADVIPAARKVWAARGEETMVFEGGGQTLMLSGATSDDGGVRSILCYLALPGRTDLDAAFDAAAARGALPDTAQQTFTTTYADVRPDQTFRVTFTRPNPDGDSAGTAGFATRLDFPAEAVAR